MEPKAQSPGNNESLQEQCVGLEGKGQCGGVEAGGCVGY